MAIIDAVPGIEVTIESRGIVLKEYADEENPWNHDDKFDVSVAKQSSMYVECESDTEFGINCSIKPPYKLDCEMLTFWVWIDGKMVVGASSRVLVAGCWSSYLWSSCQRINEEETANRKFKFCSIRKVDDVDSTRVEDDARLITGLGEILVSVHRTCDGEQIRARKDLQLKNAPSEIAEKALKGQALSHGVSFGAEMRMRKPTDTRKIHLDGIRNPIAVFSFKYRSREALQEQIIIPRSPSPSPNPIADLPNPRSRNGSNPTPQGARRADPIPTSNIVKPENIKTEFTSRGQKRHSEAAEFIASGKRYKTSRRGDGAIVVDLTDD